MFNFWKNHQTLSHSRVIMFCPHQQCTRVPTFPHLHPLLAVFCLYMLRYIHNDPLMGAEQHPWAFNHCAESWRYQSWPQVLTCLRVQLGASFVFFVCFLISRRSSFLIWKIAGLYSKYTLGAKHWAGLAQWARSGGKGCKGEQDRRPLLSKELSLLRKLAWSRAGWGGRERSRMRWGGLGSQFQTGASVSQWRHSEHRHDGR